MMLRGNGISFKMSLLIGLLIGILLCIIGWGHILNLTDNIGSGRQPFMNDPYGMNVFLAEGASEADLRAFLKENGLSVRATMNKEDTYFLVFPSGTLVGHHLEGEPTLEDLIALAREIEKSDLVAKAKLNQEYYDAGEPLPESMWK